MSSVAITIWSKQSASTQRSQTCRINGLPAIPWSAFPGNRVDPHRAGIMPTTLFIGMTRLFSGFVPGSTSQDELSRFVKVFGHECRVGFGLSTPVIAPTENSRPDSSPDTRLGIGHLVP